MSHPSMLFTEKQLFKTLEYMNDDLLDLLEKPDMFLLIINHYIFEARIYLSQFEEEKTRDVIESYIDSWNNLSEEIEKNI